MVNAVVRRRYKNKTVPFREVDICLRMHQIAVKLGQKVSIQNIQSGKPHQRQRQIKENAVQRFKNGGTETSGQIKMFGRVVRYVHRPKKAAVMANVMQNPVQKILRYHQHKPVEEHVFDLEKAELVKVIQHKKRCAFYY